MAETIRRHHIRRGVPVRPTRCGRPPADSCGPKNARAFITLQPHKGNAARPRKTLWTVVFAVILCVSAFGALGTVPQARAAGAVAPLFSISAPIQVGTSPIDNAYDAHCGCWLIANSVSDTVTVIRANTSVTLATVPVGNGASSVEDLYNATTGFDEALITNINDNTVSILNVTMLSVTATLPVGNEPVKVCFDPDDQLAFVLNSQSDNVSIIDLNGNVQLGNISFGINPEAPVEGWVPAGCAYDDDTDEMFVSLSAGNQVTVVNTAHWMTPVWIANVTNVYSPQALSIAPSPFHETFVNDEGAAAETIITHHAPHIVAVVNVGNEPLDSDFDAATAQVFVANSGSDTVNVISATSNAVVATIGVGLQPSGIVYDPVDGLINVVNTGSSTVQIISDGTGGTNDTTWPGAGPGGGGGGPPTPAPPVATVNYEIVALAVVGAGITGLVVLNYYRSGYKYSR